MKFKITNKQHPKHPHLYRIIRNDGLIGGYIQYEYNLSQDPDDDAWVGGNACIFGNARIYDGAVISGYAEVSGNSHIFGNNTKILDECVIVSSSINGVILNGCSRIYNSEIVSNKAEKTILTDLKLESGSSLKMSDKILGTTSNWENGLLGQDEQYVRSMDDVIIQIVDGTLTVTRKGA